MTRTQEAKSDSGNYESAPSPETAAPPPPSQTNWWLIGGLIVAVIIVAGSVTYYVRQRKPGEA